MMNDTTTPKNLDELRELVMAISRKQTHFSMGSKTLRALGRLVERPEIVAVSTITELAENTGVNASTLSRLAQSLGYDGFGEFQKLFRNAVSTRGKRFYSGQASQLLSVSDVAAETNGNLASIGRLFQESIANVEACLAELDPLEIEEAVDHLAHAPRVRVHAIRQIHSVAAAFAYGMNLIRRDVSLLDTPGSGMAEGLANMEKGDVLVLASVYPYSRAVAEASEIAHRRGLIVIALTDYRTSPLAINADYSFFIPHQSSYISNSMGAYIIFCEGLVNSVARLLDTHALESLNRHEVLIDRLRVEIN